MRYFPDSVIHDMRVGHVSDTLFSSWEMYSERMQGQSRKQVRELWLLSVLRFRERLAKDFFKEHIR